MGLYAGWYIAVLYRQIPPAVDHRQCGRTAAAVLVSNLTAVCRPPVLDYKHAARVLYLYATILLGAGTSKRRRRSALRRAHVRAGVVANATWQIVTFIE